jgi:hypothetical protein
MRLTELANRFGTDKGTVSLAGHGYTLVYEILFDPLREGPIRLLEIGLCAGGPEVGGDPGRQVLDAPSVRMWHEYFPRGRIYGLDISDFSRFESDWFEFMRADCGDPGQLEEIAGRGIVFDIIIDDGSHASFHQQLTLCKMFPCLRSGGIYAIEDLNWQPEQYERALPAVPKTAALLADYLGTGSFSRRSAAQIGDWDGWARDVANVMLFDDDQLAAMRQHFNRSSGDRPQTPHYVDAPLTRRILSRGHARRIVEAVIGLARAARGDTPPFHTRTKLAIIQKQ